MTMSRHAEFNSQQFNVNTMFNALQGLKLDFINGQTEILHQFTI